MFALFLSLAATGFFPVFLFLFFVFCSYNRKNNDATTIPMIQLNLITFESLEGFWVLTALSALLLAAVPAGIGALLANDGFTGLCDGLDDS